MKNMKGFIGKTHALLSILLFLICILIPVDFFKKTIGIMRDETLFFIVGLIVLVGGSLLPDLDNGQSSAGATLGAFGSICTTFMQTISSICWTFLHGKGDKMPPSQHRYLWHTLIVGGGIFSLFYFGMPQGEQTLYDTIKRSDDLALSVQENAIVLFFIILIFMAILVGSNMVLSKLISVFKLPKILNYILPTIMLVYLFFIDMSHLRILGICLGMGYIFHPIEDCFADTGVPILWPLPIKKQLWKRIKFPITITTGSLPNTILDIILIIIDALLLGLMVVKII